MFESCPNCSMRETYYDGTPSWDGERCKWCKFDVIRSLARYHGIDMPDKPPAMLAAAPPPEETPSRDFFPPFDPSMPIGQLIRYPFVMILLGCWLSCFACWVLIMDQVWAGPPEAKDPRHRMEKFESNAKERAAAAAFQKYSEFQAIQQTAMVGSVAPFAMLFLVFLILFWGSNKPVTYGPTDGLDGSQFLAAILGTGCLIASLTCPFVMLYRILVYYT